MFRQARWDEPLLFELDDGVSRTRIVEREKEVADFVGSVAEAIPERLRRDDLPLPRVSEPRLVRHFVRLSQMSFGVDLSSYPLGSCTMKYSVKIAERLSSHEKVSNLHPYQPEETVQGILKILYEFARLLEEITGFAKFSLIPAAGAHGEFVGCLIIRKVLENRGEKERDEMIVPDSAHGTNPASAAMANFKVVRVPSDEEGLVDIEALKASVSRRTAGIMLTVPNTLGLFEKNVLEIVKIVKEAGGLAYYDGANLNAIIGLVRPGDLGFDITHLNLHKTFSTPHGGGGPGSGPLGVSKEFVDYLPVPTVEYDGKDRYYLNYDLPKSVGRIRSFYGNISVILKAYVYLLFVGRENLKNIAYQSVLSSNYLLSLIDKNLYTLPYSHKLLRKHEFVIKPSPQLKEKGVTTRDIAKALLDYGVHAPTIYFPHIVEEALMIEPTESETKEELEFYARALNEVAEKALQNPEEVRKAPRNLSVGRVDEVRASHPRYLTVTWRKLRER